MVKQLKAAFTNSPGTPTSLTFYYFVHHDNLQAWIIDID